MLVSADNVSTPPSRRCVQTATRRPSSRPTDRAGTSTIKIEAPTDVHWRAGDTATERAAAITSNCHLPSKKPRWANRERRGASVEELRGGKQYK